MNTTPHLISTNFIIHICTCICISPFSFIYRFKSFTLQDGILDEFIRARCLEFGLWLWLWLWCISISSYFILFCFVLSCYKKKRKKEREREGEGKREQPPLPSSSNRYLVSSSDSTSIYSLPIYLGSLTNTQYIYTIIQKQKRKKNIRAKKEEEKGEEEEEEEEESTSRSTQNHIHNRRIKQNRNNQYTGSQQRHEDVAKKENVVLQCEFEESAYTMEVNEGLLEYVNTIMRRVSK